LGTAAVAADSFSFTSFDVRGAGNYFVAGINDEGKVAGNWTAADGSIVGFISRTACCTRMSPGVFRRRRAF